MRDFLQWVGTVIVLACAFGIVTSIATFSILVIGLMIEFVTGQGTEFILNYHPENKFLFYTKAFSATIVISAVLIAIIKVIFYIDERI